MATVLQQSFICPFQNVCECTIINVTNCLSHKLCAMVFYAVEELVVGY